MVMASEVGVFDVDPDQVVQKGRLRPGRMLLVDTKEKTITRDEELKKSIAESRPHSDWGRSLVTLEELRKEHRKPIGNSFNQNCNFTTNVIKTVTNFTIFFVRSYIELFLR